MSGHAFAAALQQSRPVRGFTMIEVLIALVVLSIGILGVLALQIHSLSYSHSAYLTSVASVQAMDLEERMRANRGAAGAYDAMEIADISTDDAAVACQSEAGGRCDAQSLAEYDMRRWVANTRRLFPPSLELGLQSLGAGVYELTLQWEGRGPDADAEDRTMSYLFRLDTV